MLNKHVFNLVNKHVNLVKLTPALYEIRINLGYKGWIQPQHYPVRVKDAMILL